jgi:sulfhydrogenase subunit delta
MTKKKTAKKTTKQNKKKPVVAFLSLSGCEGCSFAMLDLGGEFFNALVHHYKLGEHHFLEEMKGKRHYDITFVDGAPLTKENEKVLKDMRERTDYMVAVGSCAALGVVPGIKNYVDKKKKAKYVYPKTKKPFNPDIHPISRYVKVDLVIPGCPIDNKEFLKIFTDVAQGIEPELSHRPVCYECQSNGNPCLLQQGEPCLGPVIQGGCNAVCLNSRYYCRGCRGILQEDTMNDAVKTLNKKLENMIGKRALRHILQIYGIQEDWLNKL